ncbi:hypothetical protein JW992_01175 [candidate division KSB1 bacterium]|nr:hypothetical protein [candidate division KSB1 bacterium]
MPSRIVIFIFLFCTVLLAQSIVVDPLTLLSWDQNHLFVRSIYSVESTTSADDTLLFRTKVEGLTCTQVDSISPFELSCEFRIDSGFTAFGEQAFVVLDGALNQRLQGIVPITTVVWPSIDSVIVRQNGRARRDTLVFDPDRPNQAHFSLYGSGVFCNSEIVFDHSALEPVAHTVPMPASVSPLWKFTVQVDGPKLVIGPQTFRIRHPYVPEASAPLFLSSAQPPRIIDRVPAFIADGNERVFNLQGSGFFPGMQAHLLPDEGRVRIQKIERNEIRISLHLPVRYESRAFRLVVRNADGRADTTAAFSVGALPLPTCRIKSVENGMLFFDTPARVAFVVEIRNQQRLDRRTAYELRVGEARFPVSTVVNDSTFEALIDLPHDEGSSLIRERVFTLHPLQQPAAWKGVFKAKIPPQIDYFSPIRILHPLDTLEVVLKGRYLHDVQLVFSDPALSVRILENRGDLIVAKIHARAEVEPGEYAVELRIGETRFSFPQYRLSVKPWQRFDRYVDITTRKVGRIGSAYLWQESGVAHQIDKDDGIVVQFDGDRLQPQEGEQKVRVSGVLLDSTHTVRAEALNPRWIVVRPGEGTVSWQWRVRERLGSGDRIEITLSNPGQLQRRTERFAVKRHWSQDFHGSTSFVVVKLPFDGGKASTEILKSMTIGLTYTPDPQQTFLAYDAAFIVGNVNSKDDVSVQVGLGVSVILRQYIQIGLGTNLTRPAFQRSFMFLGTRFKLPAF